MSDFKVHVPDRPKPRPGSLPMRSEAHREPHPAQDLVPPFIPLEELLAEPPQSAPKPKTNHAKLKEAMKKVNDLRDAVRDDVFDDWVRRYLVSAEQPSEWTRATELYANYLKRAPECGQNRRDKALSKGGLATKTRFGILLRDAGFEKFRRQEGYFYPLRLKQGA